MKILENLNDLKDMLNPVEQAGLDLPQEIQGQFADAMQKIRDDIIQAGSIVEKYYQDKAAYEKMFGILEKKMDVISIYDGMDEKVKNKIVDKIIRSKDLNLLTEETLRKHIEKHLRGLNVDDLAKKAYSKQDILKLGEAVESRKASESKKYDAGMSVIRDLLTTTRGREEAMAYGVSRLMKDVMTRRYFISLYYGLTK